jgi:putative membrane-bound dehydrogenase-like protein
MKPTVVRPAVLLLVLGLTSAYLGGQGFAPDDAVKRMKVADGMQVKLVASEPMIRQPVTMSFDDQGRMWVIQYLQYPNPAGLKAVKVDEFLRTKYDKLPEPPPRGPKGEDRITILSDPDGHGRYRKAKDFVSGLNLASGMCLGHGGVFVAQSPYLLFYPDRNGDDVPDADPEVLLTGFGMEDAHAFPNSLQWGPDGWLYGAQGSTVTANIRGIEFQQGIWRYHPLTKEFELFAEGGGNTWGVDFDRHGNLIAGTNFGGVAMLHQVQGGYYIKNFGKHGALHNPHTYGYFDHMPCDGFKGGHVTCGGIIYEGGALPRRFNHAYLAANLLSNTLYWYTLDRKGSTFTSKFGGDLLVANDTWFRPVDCLTGPDGALYVADWYDKRATHLDPIDNWDRTNGRIYRIESSSGPKPLDPSLFPLSKLTSDQLVQLLDHPNDWYHREARRILAERRDAAVIPKLCRMVRENREQSALEALWALYVSGGFDDEFAAETLVHSNEDVRTWTIRFVGDAKRVSPAMRERLIQIARRDGSATVRSQLACSSKRLPASDALPIVRALLERSEDVNDPYIPLLLWWAIEDKAISERESLRAWFKDEATWNLPLVRRHIVERLARRYMADGSDAGYSACAQLLGVSPRFYPTEIILIHGMEQALEGRRLSAVPKALQYPLAQMRKIQSPLDLGVLRLAVRLGDRNAYDEAVGRLANSKMPQGDRLGLIELLGQAGDSQIVPLLLKLLDVNEPNAIRLAALSALQPFDSPTIAEAVLTAYPNMSAGLRIRSQSLLCSRKSGTLALLRAIDSGKIASKEVPPDQVHRMAQHSDATARQLIEKHWGKVGPATAGEKLARIRYLSSAIKSGKGDPGNGKPLFTKHCATCHTLFGEGTKIGPDLTGSERKNLEFLLSNIVDPSAVIRPEYMAHIVQTTDGRLLTGLIVEATPAVVTLVNEKNERTVLPREKIEELKPSPISLMPEKLLDTLDDQQIRDLFSYLQSEAPAAGAK